ncbi:hypothetical protein [Sphingomonas sp.]|uniref:hypothetical protein n=1 Tax=Sphingomonas sp. TaxID=28214 RepID=UPI003CC6BB7C
MRRLLLLLPLPLAACGSAVGLKAAPGAPLPVAPYGARAIPAPTDLITPTQQQRPQRSDELLKSSEQRRSDDFDLPPDDAGGAGNAAVANMTGNGS